MFYGDFEGFLFIIKCIGVTLVNISKSISDGQDWKGRLTQNNSDK